MMARCLLIIAIAISASSASAATPLQPTGKWWADFAKNMCVLQRDYGSPQAPLTLAFRPLPMSDKYTAYIFDPPGGAAPAYVPIRIGFGPGLPSATRTLATFDVRQEKIRFSETEVAREELERAAATKLITFDAGKRLRYAFSVPGLAGALKILDECVVDLIDTWGFSRERQQAVAKMAEPLKPLHTYFGPKDYPDRALLAGESGANSARFKIDAQGRVSDCVVVESSHSSSLDAAICHVTKRFRYRSAVDKAGQPVESIGFIRIRWIVG